MGLMALLEPFFVKWSRKMWAERAKTTVSEQNKAEAPSSSKVV